MPKGYPGSRATGSVEEARRKAGVVHPLGHRERRPGVFDTVDDSDRAGPEATGKIGTLRRIAEEAEEAVDNPSMKDSLQKPKITGRPKGNPDWTKGSQADSFGGRRRGANKGKGQGKGSGGRREGQGNAMPRILKELIFTAMDMVGRDGRGKDKAAGYLARVAIRHPDIFGRFIEKLIPYTLSGPGGGPVQVTYDNRDAILQRMKERGMPLPPGLQGPAGQLRNAPEVGDSLPHPPIVESFAEAVVQEDIQGRDGETAPIQGDESTVEEGLFTEEPPDAAE